MVKLWQVVLIKFEMFKLEIRCETLYESADKTIKIWQSQIEQLLRTLTGHSGSIYAVAISPDNQILVSASADQTIQIWQSN